jgi:hypothetical protein
MDSTSLFIGVVTQPLHPIDLPHRLDCSICRSNWMGRSLRPQPIAQRRVRDHVLRLVGVHGEAELRSCCGSRGRAGRCGTAIAGGDKVLGGELFFPRARHRGHEPRPQVAESARRLELDNQRIQTLIDARERRALAQQRRASCWLSVGVARSAAKCPGLRSDEAERLREQVVGLQAGRPDSTSGNTTNFSTRMTCPGVRHGLKVFERNTKARRFYEEFGGIDRGGTPPSSPWVVV